MGITQVGNKVIAVGTFTSVSPSATFANKADDITRNRIFAFDANTGAIDTSFNPNLGGAANSVDTDGTYIYVGGKFGSVGGHAAIKRVVKLDAAGAVVGAFKSVPNKVVNEVVVRGSRVYLGGALHQHQVADVTSQRGALAALDATTGAVLADVNLPFAGVYDPTAASAAPRTSSASTCPPTARASSRSGTSPPSVGSPRAQVAVLDTSGGTATLAPWFTNRFDRGHNNCAGVFDTFIRDVDFSPDGSYFVVTHHRCVRRRRWRRAPCATPPPGGRPRAPATTPPGPTTPAATRRTASRSPAARSTSAGTCAGRTTRSRATRPVREQSRAKASLPSTRSTACHCRGTPVAPAAWARRRCSPPARGCGWAATRP